MRDNQMDPAHFYLLTVVVFKIFLLWKVQASKERKYYNDPHVASYNLNIDHCFTGPVLGIPHSHNFLLEDFKA